jgi:hypothetical protein
VSDEVSTTTVNAVKTMSDGTVKLSVEKYNELLETVADQKSRLVRLTETLNKTRNEPPVINRTNFIKTDEMVAADHRVWGGSLMGLGASLFIIGALRYKASLT